MKFNKLVELILVLLEQRDIIIQMLQHHARNAQLDTFDMENELM